MIVTSQKQVSKSKILTQLGVEFDKYMNLSFTVVVVVTNSLLVGAIACSVAQEMTFLMPALAAELLSSLSDANFTFI